MHLSETRLLTEGEAAERLNVSLPGLRRWRRLGIGPRPTLLHKLIRYEEDSIREFVDEKTAGHAEQEDGAQAQLDRAEAAKEEK